MLAIDSAGMSSGGTAMGFDAAEVGGWITAANSVMDLFKASAALLPKSAAKDNLRLKIAEADAALKRADARLAGELGYKLCRCTFPPQIMLSDREVCPVCGHREQ